MTDRQAGWAYAGHYGPSASCDLHIDPKGPFVHAALARELEREVSRLRAALYVIAYADAKPCEDEAEEIACKALEDRADYSAFLPNVKAQPPSP